MKRNKMVFGNLKMLTHDFYFHQEQFISANTCKLSKVTEALNGVLSKTNTIKPTSVEAALLLHVKYLKKQDTALGSDCRPQRSLTYSSLPFSRQDSSVILFLPVSYILYTLYTLPPQS